MKYKDREETPIAGDAYYIGPGHVPTYVESGTEFFEFSPKEKMDEVGQSLLKKGRRLQQRDQNKTSRVKEDSL